MRRKRWLRSNSANAIDESRFARGLPWRVKAMLLLAAFMLMMALIVAAALGCVSLQQRPSVPQWMTVQSRCEVEQGPGRRKTGDRRA